MKEDLQEVEALFEEKQRKFNSKELNEVSDEELPEIEALFQQKREALGISEEAEDKVSENSLVGMGLIDPEVAEIMNNSLMDKATRAMMDLVVTAGTSSIGAVPSLLAGLTESAKPTGDYESAKRVMDGVMSAFTIEPKSDEGQYVLGQLGEWMSFIGEFQEKAGDKALDLTESDVVATAVYAFPDLIASMFGAKATMNKLNNTKETFQNDPLTKERLSKGEESADLAPLKINEKGKVVKDKAAINVMREGIPAKNVAGIKNAGASDKAKMLKASAIFKAKKGSQTIDRAVSTYNVVGESFTTVLDKLQKERRRLGQNLDGVVKSDVFKNTNVDLNTMFQGFGETLQKQGLLVEPIVDVKSVGGGKLEMKRPTGRYRLNFDNSKVMNLSDEFKRTLDEAVNIIYSEAKGGVVSARQAHVLKKKLDDLIDYEMVSAGGQSGVKSLNYSIFELRKNIDGMLDSMFPDSYGKVNAELSPILEVSGYFKSSIKQMGTQAGKRDVTEQLGQRFMSGNKSAEEVSQASVVFRQKTQEVQRVLKKQGIKPTYNIDHQLNFLDTLNSLEDFGDIKGIRSQLFSAGEGMRIAGNLSPSVVAKIPLYLTGATLRGAARFKDADVSIDTAVNRRVKALDELLKGQQITPWDIKP
jgi:hypothetical protein